MSPEILLDLVREYLWTPLVLLVCSAVGLHIKWQREERLAQNKQIQVLHARITNECTTKADHAKTEKTLDEIKDNVKWLTRNRNE